MKKLLSLCVIALIGPACTATPERETNVSRAGRDCFNVRSVDGFASVDRDTIRLDAGPRRRYEVDLVQGGLCDQVDWAQRLALESRPSSWICTGNGPGLGDIHFRDAASGQRVSCMIDAVRRLEPAR